MMGLSQIRKGMAIYSSDGEKLGKVVDIQEDFILVEKGFFFPKDYAIRADDIASVTGDDVTLLLSKDRLQERGDVLGAASIGQQPSEDRSRDMRGDLRARSGDEVRVPVAEEQLDVLKRERETGAVRVHKEVIEERKTMSVPVMREEVHVERVPVDPGRPMPPGTAAFQGEDIVVPVREEEVEVRKRPVVTEEVVIRKDRAIEERRVAEGLRHEEVRVADSGEDARRRTGLNDDDYPRRS